MNPEKETLEKIKLMLLCGNESQAIKHIENYGKFKDKEKYNFAINFVKWAMRTRFDSSGKFLNKTSLEILEIYKKEKL